MLWFWSFLLYSFLGFLLEAGYALWLGKDPDRKCLVFFPLCPVYGFGACAVLLLPEGILRSPLLLALLGGLTAAAVEYLAALFYQKILSVSFWDYQGLPGNLHGRVCLPFTAVWGVLLLPAVYWIQPAVSHWFALLPASVTWVSAALVGADFLVSAFLLRRTGNVACLRWYRRIAASSWSA